MRGFLNSNNKIECFGCEACAQACSKSAISMIEDEEGFRYPIVNNDICVRCGICNKACPYENPPLKDSGNKYVFGGYHLDDTTRFESTSGGAFSAIADAYCNDNYVIFGAEAKVLKVFHSFIIDKKNLGKFRKSKYCQSIVGNSYTQVKQCLKEGKKVLFSGTPCQIAGLKAYLGKFDQNNLLTVEVICEGVPSPLYVKKLEQKLQKKYGAKIESFDYRYTGKSFFSNGKWDFEIMRIKLVDKKKELLKDRWFNPFWSIWLNHLMSRPSCYECKFTTKERAADISLGDLWGVHLYCPELYGKNNGSSLIIANTDKGKQIVKLAQQHLFGHELKFDDALQYQSPMCKSIDYNPDREAFMMDLKSSMDFDRLNKKWTKRLTLKLLWQKYVWGNRQKIFIWNLKNSLRKKEK